MFRTFKILAVFCVALAMGSVEAKADTFGTGANQFTLEFVPILGGSNNPTSGIPAGNGFTFTGVANDYRMGTCEITNDQWNKFTAVYGVVTGEVMQGGYGISSFNWGTGETNFPTNNVSWFEAAQFVNYLNTSTGHAAAYRFIGAKGTGNYFFHPWSVAEAAGGTNLYRHKDAFYYLPTESEWVKAAYWNGASLQTYATKTNTAPTQGNGTSGTGWNYYDHRFATDPYSPWAVGSGSQELNGTYDMMGNAWEWMESPLTSGEYHDTSSRRLRGGSFDYNANYVASSYPYSEYPEYPYSNYPGYEKYRIGFRVASVPEPSSITLLIAGGVALLGYGWRKRRVKRGVSIAAVFCVAFVMGGIDAKADTFGAGANQFTLDFVPISGATNPTHGIPGGDDFTFTGVANDYRMGTYEITNDQWNKFTASVGGTVTGSQAGYSQSFYAWGGTNTNTVPTNNVSWYEAAQFVNYLNTSTGHPAAYKFTGTQGQTNYTFAPWVSTDSGYDANNPFRNSKAFYFLPTENEWVKAAYWNGTSLQQYATKGNTDLTQGNGTNGTGWNFYTTQSATNPPGPWAVGSGSQELNGTYDMMGNIAEWTESPYTRGDYSDSSRALRGGLCNSYARHLVLSHRGMNYPTSTSSYIGFRVASVPEPGSFALLIAGGVALLGYGWRKRRVKRGVSIAAVFCVAVVMGGVDAKADTFGTGANEFTLEFVNISDGNNPTSGIPAGDGFTFTGVANDCRMGTYEITNDQWNKFEERSLSNWNGYSD